MADITFREVLVPIVREVLAEERSGALMVSQRNCEAVLGLPARTHLENCRRADFAPRVVRLGKLRLVDAREYALWLHAQTTSVGRVVLDEEENGASQVLREIGLFPRQNGTVERGRPRLTADRAGPKVR